MGWAYQIKYPKIEYDQDPANAEEMLRIKDKSGGDLKLEAWRVTDNPDSTSWFLSVPMVARIIRISMEDIKKGRVVLPPVKEDVVLLF